MVTASFILDVTITRSFATNDIDCQNSFWKLPPHVQGIVFCVDCLFSFVCLFCFHLSNCDHKDHNQCCSISKGSIYHAKHISLRSSTMEVDWPEIGQLMEVSVMFVICYYWSGLAWSWAVQWKYLLCLIFAYTAF